MTYQVTWQRKVEKQLSQIPSYIRDKFITWIIVIERIGMTEVRKLGGYHDEPLKGNRKGQRSIRLNKAYRVIYIESLAGEIQVVEVIEVSKHEY